MSGSITRDECFVLNEVLGTQAPGGCLSMMHNTGTDKFSYPSKGSSFEGQDTTHHRNSWLMPRIARRLTKSKLGSEMHVSNWRQPVGVDGETCKSIYSNLEAKLGPGMAKMKLPNACKDLPTD
mmetsp:Transcript_51242/g.76552  ORF Transcript_51242/g.76552 Transcript_51242/m.76552 type:complete len:123 (-) Transcript_51242:293-661(-)